MIIIIDNKEVLLDDEDWDKISEYKWHIHISSNKNRTEYVFTRINTKTGLQRIYMHRLIMNTSIIDFIDHINCNGLDNIKCNLRIATKSQNMSNMPKRRDNTSGFKGVFFDKMEIERRDGLHK